MPEFCVHERHGGICEKTNVYCNLGACPYEIMQEFAPVVHGEWEQDADGDWYCTNCGEVVAICDSGKNRTYRKPYCPNCGAKMNLDNHILYPF